MTPAPRAEGQSPKIRPTHCDPPASAYVVDRCDAEVTHVCIAIREDKPTGLCKDHQHFHSDYHPNDVLTIEEWLSE